MMKRADGARITYDGLEKMYHALQADMEGTEIERDAVKELYDRCLTRNAEWAELCGKLEAALRKIEGNVGEYDLTACAQIARAALTPLETAAKPMDPDAVRRILDASDNDRAGK